MIDVAGAAETIGIGEFSPVRPPLFLEACDATLNQKQSEQRAIAVVPDRYRARRRRDISLARLRIESVGAGGILTIRASRTAAGRSNIFPRSFVASELWVAYGEQWLQNLPCGHNVKSHGAVGDRKHFRDLSAAHLGIVMKRDDCALAWR